MPLRSLLFCFLMTLVLLFSSCAIQGSKLDDAAWQKFVRTLVDKRSNTVKRSAADVPYLKKALEHSSVTVRHNAARDLRAMGPKAKYAAPELVKCFDDVSTKVSNACQGALTQMRFLIPKGTKALLKALESPAKTTTFRSYDVLALLVKKRTDKKRIVGKLVPLLDHRQGHTRQAAAQLLVTYKSSKKKDRVLAVLKDSLDWSSGEAKDRSLEFLSQLGQGEEVAAFRKKEMREAALRAKRAEERKRQEMLAIQQAEEELKAQELEEELQKEKELKQKALDEKRRAEKEKRLAAKVIADKKAGKSRTEAGRVSTSQQILRAAETTLREVSRGQLEKSDPDKLKTWRAELAILRDKVLNGDSAEQEKAVRALAKMANYLDEPIPILTRSLRSKSLVVKKEAVRALGNIRSESAVDSLIPLLDDPKTVSEAGMALQKIGTPEALSAIAPFVIQGDLKILKSNKVSARGRKPIKADSAKEVCRRLLSQQGLYTKELDLSVPECIQATGAKSDQ